MRKTKTKWDWRTRKERPKTQNHEPEEGEEAENPKEGKGFYACYLLTSLCPRFKGHTYIGFTVNPRRRIRQHNGEIRCGAVRTKKRRPWEMVLCLHGFPSNVSALQFEWAWQHPTESVAVRQAAATFKTFSGVSNKIKLAYTMLNLPTWKSLNITVNYFSTKYTNLSACCPSLPEHMKVQVRSMDDLPCYTESDESLSEARDDSNGSVDEYESEELNRQELQACPVGSPLKTASPLHASFTTRDTAKMWTDEDDYEANNASEAANANMEDLHACLVDSPAAKGSPILTSFTIRNTEAAAKKGTGEHEYEASNGSEVAKANTGELRACIVNSAGTIESPILTSFSMRDTEDGIMQTLINKSVNEFDWFTNKVLPHEKQQHFQMPSAAAPREIEVIDLLSPSPEYRIRANRKKRRVSVVCPIIDLT